MRRKNRNNDPAAGKKRKKSFLAVLLVLAVLLGVPAVFLYNKGYARNKERIAQLSAIDGVTEVKELWKMSVFFSEKYLVTFEQPLDWSDPSKGSFPQRVEVAIHDDARINVIETDGYCLGDIMAPYYLALEPAPEISKYYDGNYIHVEHRFFGNSRPADMSNTDTKYWEYHTAENAANDYHHIYQALSPVLGDKWVSMGSSRGGLMTNVYGYYYPEDMLAYVPYVAPCADGMNDTRMYDFVYTQIGDSAFGEEKGEELRGLVTAFQTEAMRYKQDLLPRFEKKVTTKPYNYPEQVKMDVIYDMDVLEFAVNFWQSGGDFEKLKEIVNMPASTASEQKAKQNAVYDFLIKIQDPQDWSFHCFGWPYYVNTATTYGQQLYNFSYLRDALAEAGIADTLSVTEEMQPEFLQDMVFTKEQKAAFVYDSSFHDGIVASLETTPAKRLMIFGGTDPWRSMAITTEENENNRIFINPTMPHSSQISNMPDDMRDEALDILSEWIGEEPVLDK